MDKNDNTINEKYGSEETLDPHDWGELRELGHSMVDDMMDYLANIRNEPVWKSPPENLEDTFKEPLPLEPQGSGQTYGDFRKNILEPNAPLNLHPRFWAWVMGSGSPFAMLSEMLAAGMNPNVDGDTQIACHVEKQVIGWLKEALNFPQEASGLLLSGCSMANLIGLTIARNTMAGFDMRRKGILESPQRMTLYASTEAHSSIEKGVELLGLGKESLRLIPVTNEFRIHIPSLERAILEDKAAGFKPFCIIGNAGTVNTGAVDPLVQLAEICKREQLWFHVDGAFGACALLSPEYRSLVRGIELADSLAFDLHKWMHMPYEAGCILVKNEEHHRDSFSYSTDYLSHKDPWFSDYGLQLSRGFKALKVWMCFKAYGIKKYGRLIEQNIEQARYLAQLVDASPGLELLAPLSLNIVCFRFTDHRLEDSMLNELNKLLLMRLQGKGIAFPSDTMIGNKYALRAAITNHRSRKEDFDLLVEEVRSTGNRLLESRVIRKFLK
ncbi:MAG: amino acid decarboxylase [bacterium]|nr:amino acid decarboxylase [bacterium]